MSDPSDTPAIPEDATFAGAVRSGPFGSVLVPGRYGHSGRAAGLFLMPILVGRVETVTARRGQLADLLDALTERLGVAVEDRPGVWTTPRRRVIGIAPGRFLLLGFDEAEGGALEPVAWRVRQTGGVALLRLTGPRLTEILSRGLSLDLDPDVFRPGSSAVTLLAHMPVTLMRLSDLASHPVHDIMTGRSYARGLARWLMEAGAATGVEINRQEADLSAGGGFFASPRSRA